MNRFGKIVSVALCGVMAMPLLACNGGGMREKYAAQALEQLYKRYEGEIEHGTEKKPIVLHVLENDTAKSSGYLKELLDGFNEQYKEYYITAVDANQDQYANLAEDGPYGYGPDVLYQANDVLMKYCAGKHIIPLPVDKLDAYSALPQLVKDTYTYNLGGNEYFMGVGVNIQAPMLYYRKDLLPENWQTEWDDNENGVPDMVEDMRAKYGFGKAGDAENAEKYGYIHSLYETVFFVRLFVYVRRVRVRRGQQRLQRYRVSGGRFVQGCEHDFAACRKHEQRLYRRQHYACARAGICQGHVLCDKQYAGHVRHSSIGID